MSFSKYLVTQLKRIKKLFLPTLGFFAIFAFILGIGALSYVKRIDENNKKVITIGVVGENDTPIISGLLGVLEKFDDIGYTMKFPSMTKEEADEAFLNENLSAYCIIPDGFEEALMYDRPHENIVFVKREGAYGLDDIYFSDMLPKISEVISDVNSGVYGFKDAFEEITGSYDSNVVNDLFLKYIDHFLDRSELVEIKDLTKENSIGEMGTLILGLSLVFVFLFALTASPYFIDQKIDFLIIVRSKGLNSAKEILAEYIAFLVYAIFLTALISFLVYAVGLIGIIRVYLTSGFVFTLFLICLMIFALQFFMYEILNGTIAKILAQFLVYIFMTYVSGYFYPAKYFPKVVREMGRLLPSGVALDSYKNAFINKLELMDFVGVISYMVIFLVLTIVVRDIKLKKEFR